jgi:hypothetical protein
VLPASLFWPSKVIFWAVHQPLDTMLSAQMPGVLCYHYAQQPAHWSHLDKVNDSYATECRTAGFLDEYDKKNTITFKYGVYLYRTAGKTNE